MVRVAVAVVHDKTTKVLRRAMRAARTGEKSLSSSLALRRTWTDAASERRVGLKVKVKFGPFRCAVGLGRWVFIGIDG